ncbi:MAG: DUF4959 domain-containing protein [Prevotellaceae bacterium]|nr:DUF4959 domain-containing protein [Prevotellaceae bacterium]
MKGIFKSKLNRDIKYLLTVISLFAGLFACEEQGRFEIGYDDSVPPSAPTYLNYKPLYGGARLYFEIPSDKDVLSIDASYENSFGKTIWFSVSYFQDSIDIYGFNDTLDHVVSLYAVDRAGNKSTIVPVKVKPLEPAVTRVAKSLIVKGGFSAFYVDWRNELEQNINVYVDFSYTQKGQYKEQQLIYTSTDSTVRWFIRDLDLTPQEPVSIKVRVEDMYENITDYIDKGQIVMLEDEIIPKDKWTMPENDGISICDSVGGVPMAFLSAYEGHGQDIIDGIVDDGKNGNFVHTGGRGRTGGIGGNNRNVPYNVLIDLGDEYELSRIITHQRYTHVGDSDIRQDYYRAENVGVYAMYIWDDAEQKWDSVSMHKIPMPVGKGLTAMDYKQAGTVGDMAFLYPDDPKFSKPTRWFRYEALYGFTSNYTSTGCNCLSEITLYGRKKN